MKPVIITLILLISAPNPHSATTTDALYQTAVAQIDSVPILESINAFKRVVKADRKYAPAYNQIAKLYLHINSINDRQRAERAIKEALRLDRKNLDYKLTMGDVLWQKGFWSEAVGYYKKVLKKYPDATEAAYRIGRFALNEYMNYKDHVPRPVISDMDKGLYRDRSSSVHRAPPEIIYLSMNQFSKKDLLKSTKHLKKSIALDPTFKDGYYQLGLLYLEAGKPDGMIRLMQELLERDPDDKDALLFSGLGYYRQKKMVDAAQYFKQAFMRMLPEEQLRMQSVDLITTPEERENLPELTATGIPSRADSLTYKRFWRRQDPLMLTQLNERTLDHYVRFAYANLCFSRPSRRIEGWKTDRGETYIRYGNPLVRKTGKSMWGTMERWVYDGYSFTFYSRDGFYGWKYKDASDAKRTKAKQGPRRTDDPYRKQKYSLPHFMAAFQEGDRVRLELAYAVPRNRLTPNIAGELYLSDGIFVFDQDWNEVYSKPADVILPVSKQAAEVPDSSHTSYFTTQHTLRVSPGQYWLGGEVVDRTSLSIGTFQDSLICVIPDTAFGISDLLLASRIKTQTPFPEQRTDLNITPNPLRTFSQSNPVFIYLEMYNLTRDAFGQTRYTISYRLGRPRNQKIDPRLFMAQDIEEKVEEGIRIRRVRIVSESVGGTRISHEMMDLGATFIPHPKDLINKRELAKAKTQTEIASEYQGDQPDDLTFLQIDVNELPAAIYELTVTVTDQHTKKAQEKHVLFRVIE